MVFFTCSHCGESLKKNKVEKHYHTVCRGNPVAVSCVDCCKDFNEETVVAHTKCVTEEERYAAKVYTPKPSANKGERKQQRWQDVITTVKETRKDLRHNEKHILSLLVNQENVPRKRNKFQNYLKQHLHREYKEDVANRVFDILEEQSKLEEKEKTNESQENGETEEKENMSVCENEGDKEQQTEKLSKKERKELKKKAKYEAQLKQIENENNEEPVKEEEAEEDVPKKSKKSKKNKEMAVEEPVMENGTDDGKAKKKHKSKTVENGNIEVNNVEPQQKSKKKRKKETAEEEEPAEKKAKDLDSQEEEEVAPKQKFNWEKVIVSLLEAKDDKELSLKRLKKKVLAELESCGETNTEKNLTKFNKKIHKIPGVVVLKDKVKLKAESA